MITSEELENCDIFPKQYTFTCLFKFIFYTLVSLLSFLLLISFYSDKELMSIISLDSVLKSKEYNTDYLTEKIIKENSNNNIFENSYQIQNYSEYLINNFFKEYIMTSSPVIINNCTFYLNISKIYNYLQNEFYKAKTDTLFIEIKEKPETQFFEESFRYKQTNYKKYKELIKEDNNTNYFINEININDILPGSMEYLLNNFLYNKLTNNLELESIEYTESNFYNIIWTHSEISDNIICAINNDIDFILIPSNQKKYLHLFKEKELNNYSKFNFFNSFNRNLYSNDFNKIKRLFINLSVNDCIYIPSYWYRSIRINFNKINENNAFITFKYKSNSKYLNEILK